MESIDTLRSLAQARNQRAPSVVAIGNFDGVHLGHQAILRHTRRLAQERGLRSVALTFEPHPVRFFRPDVAPFRLTPPEQKISLIGQNGIDAVAQLPFDAAMANRTPEQFVDDVLHDALNARAVIVGGDFHFGKGRAGATQDLRRLGAIHGIDVEICESVEVDGQPVSSTRVREAVAAAELEQVVRLLGRPYRIAGTVVHGDARGRKLGFPTANLAADQPVLVPHGVYATTLHVPGYPPLHAITNVGTRPTFEGDDSVTVESFVLNHDDELDLYDSAADLDFWRFVRPEKKFDSPQDLVAQIERDVAQVREHFKL